jgi:hypothetical protein
VLYTLQMQTVVAGLPWRYCFEAESNNMAVNLARSFLRPYNLPQSCTSVVLFSGDDMAFADFKLTEPTLLVTDLERR